MLAVESERRPHRESSAARQVRVLRRGHRILRLAKLAGTGTGDLEPPSQARFAHPIA